MAISIVIGNKVGFKVKGSINDENGAAQAFDFGLRCKRLEVDDIDGFFGGDYAEPKVIEFLVSVIESWIDVKDASKAQVPYAEDILRQLCKDYPGLSYLTFKAYREEVGVKAKNS